MKQKVPQSLTQMRISFPVTAGHVSTAAPISLANSAFIQGVGGKENAIAPNRLQKCTNRVLRVRQMSHPA